MHAVPKPTLREMEIIADSTGREVFRRLSDGELVFGSFDEGGSFAGFQVSVFKIDGKVILCGVDETLRDVVKSQGGNWNKFRWEEDNACLELHGYEMTVWSAEKLDAHRN